MYNFPVPVAVGDVFAPPGGPVWRWNGYGWEQQSPGGPVSEAPLDHKKYVRQDASWSVLTNERSLLDWIDPSLHAAIIAGTSTTDVTAQCQAAAASGYDIYVPAGKYNITDMVTMSTGRSWRGAERTRSIFAIGSGFNLSASGVFRLGTGEPGATLRDLGFVFTQPSFAGMTRADLIHYPPAIYAVGMPRFILDNVRISAAWVGVDATGNTGGFNIGRLEVSAYDTGLKIDGALDFCHINSYHFWPFGIGAGGTGDGDLWRDGTTLAARLGKTEQLNIDSFQTFKGKLYIDSNAGLSQTPKIISSLSMDSDGARLEMDNGYVSIGQLYSTKSNADTTNSIKVNGGTLSINSLHMITDQVASAILVSAGNLMVRGGYLNSIKLGQSAVEVTGGRVMLDNVLLATANGVRTKAYVLQTGGILHMTGCRAESTNASGTIVEVQSDNATNHICGNFFQGMTVVLPASANLGCYGPNRTPRKTWTPVLTFATPGDFAPTYTQQSGVWWYETNSVRFELRITFNTNAFTTAAGQARITGLPIPTTGIPISGVPVSAGICSLIDFTAGYTQFAPVLVTSGNWIALQQNGDNVTQIDISIANIKPSISNINITVSGFIAMV